MHLAAEVLAARSRRTYVPGVRIARLYAHAGVKIKLIAWLEKAYQQRETALVHLNVAWDWDTLRKHHLCFQDLLRRMNFPIRPMALGHYKAMLAILREKAAEQGLPTARWHKSCTSLPGAGTASSIL